MNRLKQANAGMSLIELMVTIGILGILAAIATPSYRSYVLRANRADAKTGLLSRAADLERCYTRNSTYLNAAATPCVAVTSLPDMSTTTYRIEADAANGGIQANKFAIRAVPQGRQADDTKCGTFMLDDKNNRSVSVAGATATQDCWGR
jgi:type IV pilus assembly protein PilE